MNATFTEEYLTFHRTQDHINQLWGGYSIHSRGIVEENVGSSIIKHQGIIPVEFLDLF